MNLATSLGGIVVLHMSNDYAKRQELAVKLRNSGCDADTSGSDWVTAGDFVDPLTRAPKTKAAKRRGG